MAQNGSKHLRGKPDSHSSELSRAAGGGDGEAREQWVSGAVTIVTTSTVQYRTVQMSCHHTRLGPSGALQCAVAVVPLAAVSIATVLYWSSPLLPHH